ncbi:hypothetical protein G6F66_013085 [Rhizopus arrhizus]|nr:hypothetical protein G6F66_013085 [Rhizopus arrhizus]
MLDLAQIHSLTLGYKWSPPKCAVLNAPTATSSRYVPMSLYGQDLPTVEEFTYLGVPFDGKGCGCGHGCGYGYGCTLKSCGCPLNFRVVVRALFTTITKVRVTAIAKK